MQRLRICECDIDNQPRNQRTEVEVPVELVLNCAHSQRTLGASAFDG